MEVVGRKGARIRTYSPSSPVVRMGYDPAKEGFIKLSVGNQVALVHKDEILYVARMAKGSMGL